MNCSYRSYCSSRITRAGLVNNAVGIARPVYRLNPPQNLITRGSGATVKNVCGRQWDTQFNKREKIMSSIDRKIWSQTKGQYVVYGVDVDGNVETMFNDVQTRGPSSFHKKQFRDYRETKKASGEHLEPVGDDRLDDELLVVFGSGMSASAAVVALENLAKQICKEGLLIGCGRRFEQVLVYETVEGDPVPQFW